MMYRVLLVDDDASVARLYQLDLEDDGYEVRTVHNGADARLLVETWQPDCAVIDVKLGDENGLDLLRQLIESKPQMHTVLLSAYPGYREDFASWLADAFVSKSSDTSTLRLEVGQLLASHPVA